MGGTKLCVLKSVVCIEMHWVSLFPLLSICHCVSYLKMGTASPERVSALSSSAQYIYQQNLAVSTSSNKTVAAGDIVFSTATGRRDRKSVPAWRIRLFYHSSSSPDLLI